MSDTAQRGRTQRGKAKAAQALSNNTLLRCLLSACLILGTSSCSSPTPPSPLASAALEQQFTPINDALVQRYLLGIVSRLSDRPVVSSLPHPQKNPTIVKKILLVKDRRPIALALPNQTLIISDGLLLSLHNEAELAFVVAHELAHLELHHHAELQDAGTRPSRQMALEQEADDFAVGVVAAAGYDPRASLGALQITDLRHHFLAPKSDSTAPSSHPDARERYFNAMNIIAESRWGPPGTVNRRDFAMVKQHLSTRP